MYPALGDRRVSSVRPSDMQAWVKGLSASLSPSTVGIAHRIVARIFRAAVRDRIIPSSLCEGVRLPQADRAPVEPLWMDAVAALAASRRTWGRRNDRPRGAPSGCRRWR